jgi:ABC-2 type transport system permease protein
MLLHLIKKDILIAKKYVFITMLAILAIPLFIMLVAPSLSGLIPFLYMVVLGELILLQAISQEEAKYPKTTALLCAAPYPRKTLVKAKYTLFLLIFAYCCFIYAIVNFFINKSGIIDLTMILTVMLVSAIIFGIYMPIEFKHGFVKARFIFMMVIIVFSLGPSVLVNLFGDVRLDFSAFATISSGTKNIVLVLANILVLGISMMVSISIFSKKEL